MGYLSMSRCWALAQSGWCKVRYLKGLWEWRRRRSRGGKAGWVGVCMLGVGGAEGDLIPYPQIRWLNNVLCTIRVEWSTQKHFSNSDCRVCGKNLLSSTQRSQTRPSSMCQCLCMCVRMHICMFLRIFHCFLQVGQTQNGKFCTISSHFLFHAMSWFRLGTLFFLFCFTKHRHLAKEEEMKE